MNKKLKLHRETLVRLQDDQAGIAQGGLPRNQFSNDIFNPCYSIYTCARGGCK